MRADGILVMLAQELVHDGVNATDP